MDSGSVAADVEITLRIDEETMAALIEEGVLMDDSDVDDTVYRRLQEGARTARIMGPGDLKLRPVHKSAFNFRLMLDQALVADLDELAEGDMSEMSWSPPSCPTASASR